MHTRTCRAVSLGLLLARSLLELHLAEVEHGARDLVERELLVVREAERVERLVCHLHLLGIVNAVDRQTALVDEEVLARVALNQQLL